jgi:hypothetical protein
LYIKDLLHEERFYDQANDAEAEVDDEVALLNYVLFA